MGASAIEALEGYGKVRTGRGPVLFETDLNDENDRAVIIILVTKIDDHLEYRIIDRMRGKLDEAAVRKLLELDRASFDRKIKIAHTLGAIDEKYQAKTARPPRGRPRRMPTR